MEPLSVSKRRALLHQQPKTEQVVTLGQATCSVYSSCQKQIPGKGLKIRQAHTKSAFKNLQLRNSPGPEVLAFGNSLKLGQLLSEKS